MQFRSFSESRARLLLYLQADIVQLEEELSRLDEMDALSEDAHRLSDWRYDKRLCKEEQDHGKRPRASILEEMLLKISQYGKLICSHIRTLA
jgi:hypothetical protein